MANNKRDRTATQLSPSAYEMAAKLDSHDFTVRVVDEVLNPLLDRFAWRIGIFQQIDADFGWSGRLIFEGRDRPPDHILSILLRLLNEPMEDRSHDQI